MDTGIVLVWRETLLRTAFVVCEIVYALPEAAA